MIHLIKKDLLLQKKSLPYFFLLLLFLTIALSEAGSAGLAISTLAIGYMLVYDAGLREEKSDGNKLLACLPIRKSTIVLSKYVSVYLYAAMVLIGSGLIRAVAKLLQAERHTFPITLEGAIGALAALTVVFSIFFPLIFKLGYIKSRVINLLVLFVVIFAGAGMMSAVAERTGVHPLDVHSAPGMVPALALVLPALLAGSCVLSLTFYRKREF